MLIRSPLQALLIALALVASTARLPFSITAARAEEAVSDRSPSSAKDAAKPGLLKLLPSDAIHEAQIEAGGRRIRYTATAGTLPLFGGDGEQTASVFYTAYVETGVDPKTRPLTFVFNGGPGAASTYLHLGLAGPRIADFAGSAFDGAATRLIDNPDAWLAFTDLVMIDPIGTGWSRTAKPDDAKSFYSIGSDASAMAKVIALYVAKNSRNVSRKYLLGESYGGFRAAKVARALQSEQGHVVTGIIMVSPLMEAAFLWGSSQYALGAALQLPSIAAAELERNGRYTPEGLLQAERFALSEYLSTLAGRPPTEGSEFYGRVAAMTGLPVDVVAKAKGHVRRAYLQQVRSNGQSASLYDAAFLAPDPHPESNSGGGSDPMLEGFTRALAGLFVGYARDELGFKTDITYTLLARDVSSRWDWGDRREPPGVSDDLRELLALNPSFRLLVAHGRTDLVTPYGVSRYVLDHIPDIGGNGRTSLKLYRGGHMFYFNPAERRAFTADAKALYALEP